MKNLLPLVGAVVVLGGCSAPTLENISGTWDCGYYRITLDESGKYAVAGQQGTLKPTTGSFTLEKDANSDRYIITAENAPPPLKTHHYLNTRPLWKFTSLNGLILWDDGRAPLQCQRVITK